MANNRKSSGGLGILAVLQVVFIVLKQCELIDWSWWRVLIPTWIGLALIAIVVLIYVALLAIEKWRDDHGR